MNIQESKIQNVVLYFANKSQKKTIDRLKLMKLIWLSDRLHLNKYGRMILNDKYKALPNGSIASKTMDMTKKNMQNAWEVNGYNIKALREADLAFFSKSDIEIMNYVWEKFKDKEPFELSEYSHLFKEWKRFEKELIDKELPNSYDIVIHDFFEFPESEKFEDLLSPKEIELSKKEFNAHNSIQKFLTE